MATLVEESDTMGSQNLLAPVSLGIWMTAVSTACNAQIAAPSQVVPQSLRPAASSQDQGFFVAGKAGLTAPAGAEDLTVMLDEVHIDGAFVSGIEPLVQDIRGKRVTLAKIYAVARALESLHAEAGYPLVRVVVPPQRLVDHGTLFLTVVDGFIEGVDIAGVPERVQQIVAERTMSIVGRRRIRLDEIERALLIAGDIPGLKLRSTLVPGSTDGATRLVLDGQHSVVSGSLGGDDRLARSLGTWQLRGSIAVNSAFGAGEQIYATAGSSTELAAAVAGVAPLAVYGGGAVIPLGEDGLSINPEYTHSTTRTARSLGVPASLGTFDRFALRLRDPVLRTRVSSLYINASVEYVSQQIGAPAFNVLLSNDRYAVARMGADYATTLSWGTALRLGGNISEGLGGRSGVDALLSGVPLSRLGAGPDFFKINGNLAASQPLPAELRFDLSSQAQWSMGRPMLRSEQLVLDGNDAVSAFALGTINVDQGATLRGELVRPFATRFDFAAGTVSPYVFGAIGYGQLFDATALEQPVISAAALGFGARSGLQMFTGSPGLNLGIELARQFTSMQGLRQGWRGNVNASMEF